MLSDCRGGIKLARIRGTGGNLVGTGMRIRVIEGNCQGHNRCKAIAPDLFDLDEYGNASAANGGAVPPGQEDMARLAVENCPEFAIEIVEE
jgi:ferredoxin